MERDRNIFAGQVRREWNFYRDGGDRSEIDGDG